MPIGAIAGATAVVGIGGAVAGSNAQKKAAQTASQTARDTTAENNALARQIYGENKGTLSPYIQQGYGANALLGDLLGIPRQQQPTNNMGGAYVGQPNALGGYGYGDGFGGGALAGYGDPMRYAGQDYIAPAPQQNALAGVAGAPQQSNYQSAFDNYRNSTGYNFRFGEGMKALNSNFAAKGILQSGAAQKAALQYGQNIASQEFGNYLGQLTNQQSVGLSAGNALAGVGTNYSANVSANNTAAAGVAANAAMASGNATSNMWNNIGGSVGNALGSWGMSSYGGGMQQNPYGVMTRGGGGIY